MMWDRWRAQPGLPVVFTWRSINRMCIERDGVARGRRRKFPAALDGRFLEVPAAAAVEAEAAALVEAALPVARARAATAPPRVMSIRSRRRAACACCGSDPAVMRRPGCPCGCGPMMRGCDVGVAAPSAPVEGIGEGDSTFAAVVFVEEVPGSTRQQRCLAVCYCCS